MKKRLIAIVLLLPALLLALALAGWAWLWHSQSGAEWLWQQARERLAVSPRAARLEGIPAGSLSEGMRIRQVVYSDASVTAKAAHVELAAAMNLFPAVLTVRRLHLGDVKFMIAEGGSDSPAGPPGRASLKAPIPVTVEDFRIDGAVIERGQVQIPVEAIAATGEWSEELSFELALRALVPGLPDTLESELAITGDADRMNLEGTLRSPEWLPGAEFRGRIEQPLANPAWSLEAAVREAAVPVDALGERVDAEASAHLAKLALHDLELRASGAGAGYEISGQARISSPWTRAATLAFDAEGEGGRLLRWSLNGTGELAAEGWPAAQVDFTAGGEEDRLSASITAPELFGGSLHVSAETRPGEGMPWEAQLTADKVSAPAIIEAVAPRLGRDYRSRLEGVSDFVQAETLSARILASGRLEPLKITADIQRLDGRLRGRDVSAGGGIAYGETGIAADHLIMESGASRLVLDGRLEVPPGLEVKVDVASLDDILPGSGGRLTGIIHYLHDRAKGFTGSELRAELQGGDIRAFDWSVGAIEISGLEEGKEADGLPPIPAVPADPPLAVSLQARDIQGPAGSVSALSAVLAGDFERQALAVGADLELARVEASLAGGTADTSRRAWSGTLEHLKLIPAKGPAWSLQSPSSLRYAGQLTLETACLSPGGDSSLCVGIEHRRDGSQQGRIDLSSVSVDLLACLAGWPLSFSQRLDGALSWTLHPDAKPSATADFELAEGVISDRLENLELLHTRDGTIRFSLDKGSLQSGTIDIPFESGTVAIDFTVPDLLAGRESKVQGRILVDLEDLDVLANFVPQLVQTDGELRADLSVGGTVGDPELAGVVELKGGQAHLLAPGLRLSEMELTGRIEDTHTIRVDGSFLAGKGRGALHADVDMADPLDPTIEVRLTGEALTLIDVPDLRLQADTDVTANWSGRELQLSGRIHVPSARFAPRYLPTDTILESPDVVIVAGGEESPRPQPALRDWKITGALEVSLGDKVVVDLDVARAWLNGKAQFKWNGPPVPIASGQYDLEGEVQAYGQTLETTRASVRFPNVPADNPHLEIRAERRIYGNSVISHAGVLIHGTLKRPVTEAYTVPPTNADRARTLLITGSDFNYEQGVGAVSIGTYISPKLYLSYGVGLFEEGNILTVRYDLKRNFGVKATSGQDDTGIDISYTIEK